DPGGFERLDNMALLQLHQLLQRLLETQFSEKTSIMKLVVRFGNERLSYELAHRIFNRMSLFYIDKSIEKQQETFLGLQHKTDSLRAMLQSKQYGLADIRDQYRSGFLFREDVPRVMLDQDVKMLQLVYAEAMKNKEIASFSLENRTPFIQEIDLPILPLKGLGPAWPKALVAGMVYGLLAGLIWIWGRKFYREKLSELQ
ncbi:MAG TPA: hypothetical protein VFX48_07435, partial [Saprospiraceae bacterium]|nr:hypothetical protein [Saprospiraceae bacterium]